MYLLYLGLPKLDVFPPTQTMEVTYNTRFIVANVSGIGAEGFTYQWSHDGIVMAGEENETLLIHDIKKSDGGVYQCIVTNMLGDNGTSNSAELIVTGKLCMSQSCSTTLRQHNICSHFTSILNVSRWSNV